MYTIIEYIAPVTDEIRSYRLKYNIIHVMPIAWFKGCVIMILQMLYIVSVGFTLTSVSTYTVPEC